MNYHHGSPSCRKIFGCTNSKLWVQSGFCTSHVLGPPSISQHPQGPLPGLQDGFFSVSEPLLWIQGLAESGEKQCQDACPIWVLTRAGSLHRRQRRLRCCQNYQAEDFTSDSFAFIFAWVSQGCGGGSQPKPLHPDPHFHIFYLAAASPSALVLASDGGWEAGERGRCVPSCCRGGVQLAELAAAQPWLVHAVLVSESIEGPLLALALGKIKHL